MFQALTIAKLPVTETGPYAYSHSFIMPMSMHRFSRHAWQCRRLSLVILQSPLNGHVNIAFLFMLLLEENKTQNIVTLACSLLGKSTLHVLLHGYRFENQTQCGRSAYRTSCSPRVLNQIQDKYHLCSYCSVSLKIQFLKNAPILHYEV